MGKCDCKFLGDHEEWCSSHPLNIKTHELEEALSECEGNDIYYNNGSNPIFIVIENQAVPMGELPSHTFCVQPGKGIDMKILNMSRIKL